MNDSMRRTQARRPESTFNKSIFDDMQLKLKTNNGLMTKIDELESLIAELYMENKNLENDLECAVQAYLDTNELYEICLEEIKLLLDTCKKHGINIPEEEHCCGIIDKIHNWI
jgi:hypothetical protein